MTAFFIFMCLATIKSFLVLIVFVYSIKRVRITVFVVA